MSQQKGKEYFFDVHIHSYNLSHPGLLAFVNRFLKGSLKSYDGLINNKFESIVVPLLRSPYTWGILIFISLTVFSGYLHFCSGYPNGAGYLEGFHISGWMYLHALVLKLLFPTMIILNIVAVAYLIYKFLKGLLTVINVLSVIENDIGRQFRLLEYDYMSLNQTIKDHMYRKDHNLESYRKFTDPIDEKWKLEGIDQRFRIAGQRFSNAIVCPMMMDFQHKGYSSLDKNKVYYNLPPKKPIIDQCHDLFRGIRSYCKISRFKLLKIFPFMGITPGEYRAGHYIELNNGNGNGKTTHKTADIVKKAPDQFNEYFWYQEKLKCKVAGNFPLNDHDLLWIKDDLPGDVIDKLKAAIAGIDSPEEDKTPKGKNDLVEFLFRLLDHVDLKKLNAKISHKDYRDNYQRNSIAKMLLKYFGKYPLKNRFNDFVQKFDRHFGLGADGAKGKDQEEEKELIRYKDVRSGFYAGIKVYPPLGYCPWPSPGDYQTLQDYHDELLKVSLIYSYCQAKGIPMTTHCGEGGFDIDGGYSPSPALWSSVLRRYPGLKINFAHFGKQKKHNGSQWREWFEQILELMAKYNNVYADISCHKPTTDNYQEFLDKLKDWIRRNPSVAGSDIRERIIFGTDFMMNLWDSKSYLHFLEDFRQIDSEVLSQNEKLKMVRDIPRKFLFGK